MENQIRFFKTENVLCIAKDEGFLGAGLTGTVRCGFHEFHGTIAAKCSVMQGKMKKRNALEKRIKEEIGLLQTFNHENIVRVYGWTQWPGAIAIIMEHLPGGNLMEVLTDEDVVLEPALRLRMSYEAANGIAFIHNLSSDRRITHGDIKPENILLTEDLHCKIADFGSARLSAYTGGTTTMTSKRQEKVQFTELYAAPEVLKDPSIKPKPPRDTYSFGVTLYMMLGREIPIPAEYMLMYLENVKKGERPSLETINDVIRQLEEEGRTSDVTIIVTLKQIMEECWQQDPTLRPLMVDVKNGLHELLAKHDLVKIQQHVVDATKDMEIKKPSRGQYKCVPLDQFSPPEFQCIADLSSMSNTSSNATTSASSNSSYREEPDVSNTNITSRQSNENNQQRIRDEIKSIKYLMEEEGSLDEAVSRCDSLINNSISSVTSDYDVIIDDVIEIVSVLRTYLKHNKAMNMLIWVVDLCDKITNPQVKLKKHRKLDDVIHRISYEMSESDQKGDIEQLCLPLLRSLHEKVNLVPTSDLKFKSETAANVMISIGSCYFYCKKYQQVDEIGKLARNNISFTIGEDAKKFCSFACCYELSAIANQKLGNYKMAVELYNKQIEILGIVEDEPEDVRKALIEDAVQTRKSARARQPYEGTIQFCY